MTTRIRTLSCFVLVLLLLVLFLVWRAAELAHPFANRDITRMTAVLVTEGNEPETGPFDVPPEHISRILQNLEPAERAQFVAFWPVLGRLDCMCKNGELLTVDLYQMRGNVGAFSVWSTNWTGEKKRYYRGGADESIIEAIRKAYAATKQK